MLLTICAAISALVLGSSAAAWAFSSYINDTIKRVSAGTVGTPSSGPLNIVLAGVDVRAGLTPQQQARLHVGHDVSSNSDTLMVIHVAADRSRVTVVSIPRDSWVDIPGHGMNKVNAAYGLGGPQLVVQTVEHSTGLTINDYVQVNFLGFVQVIDALGGVNVCVPFAVDDSYSGLHLSAGMHHVDGVTALEFARDRHSFALSDLARISDQQQLMASLLKQAISSGTLANPVKLTGFLHAALAAISVDKGFNVTALADQMRGISASDVRFLTVPLSSVNYQTPTGESAVLWNSTAAQALFSGLKNDTAPAPAPPGPARPAPSPHASASSGNLRPGQVPVEVYNGTLISGLSATTGADLTQLGFPVQAGLTWPVHDLAQTLIQYPPGQLAAAEVVRQAIPGGTLQQTHGLTRVRVLLGASGATVATSGASGATPAASPAASARTAAQAACG